MAPLSEMATSTTLSSSFLDDDLLVASGGGMTGATTEDFLHEDLDFFYYIPQQIEKKRRKRVRINDKPQICSDESYAELTQEEKMNYWWLNEEFQKTKSLAKTRCREFRREGTFKEGLINAYTTGTLNNQEESSSSISWLDGSEDRFNLIQEMKQPNIDLIQWFTSEDDTTATGSTIRGLERWANKANGAIRVKDVREAKRGILSEQSRQRTANVRDEIQIARIAQRASHRSRAFARLMGQVDERTVAVIMHNNNNCCNDDDIMTQFCSLKRKRFLYNDTEIYNEQNNNNLFFGFSSRKKLRPSSDSITWDILSNSSSDDESDYSDARNKNLIDLTVSEH